MASLQLMLPARQDLWFDLLVQRVQEVLILHVFTRRGAALIPQPRVFSLAFGIVLYP